MNSDAIENTQQLDHAAERLHQLGLQILESKDPLGLQDEQMRSMLDTVERILTDTHGTMQQDLAKLRKELKDMRADLKDLQRDFDKHNRLGDSCPHTGR